MEIWGRGLLQSEDDYKIAEQLTDMAGGELLFPGVNEGRADTVKKLNDGRLSEMFERVLSPDFHPRYSHHKRERVAVILGLLAMQLGVIIENRYLNALRVVRSWLPTIEQQVQLLAALEGYKNNGTPWDPGSKGLFDTREAQAKGPTKYDLGDEYWYSGLGHSLDERPTSEMVSVTCLYCGSREAELHRCGQCKMGRYCDKECQRSDWPIHKRVCYLRPRVRVCPVPKSSGSSVGSVLDEDDNEDHEESEDDDDDYDDDPAGNSESEYEDEDINYDLSDFDDDD